MLLASGLHWHDLTIRLAPYRPAALKHWFLHLHESRPQRIILLLIGIWIMQYFDLNLTLIAQQHGMLGEQNPIARQALRFGVLGVTVYKFSLMTAASIVLYWYRRLAISEYLLWGVFFSFVALSLHWQICVAIFDSCWPAWMYCQAHLPPDMCQAPS